MAAIMAEVAEEDVIATEPPVDVAARAQRFRLSIREDETAASWVLDDGGRVVGHAGVSERTPGVLSLGLVVRRAARRQGGGRALLDAVIAHARAGPAHKLELEVWVDNAPAIALYAATGFEVEGLRRRHYRRRDGRLRSALLMAQMVDNADGGGAPSPESLRPPGANS